MKKSQRRAPETKKVTGRFPDLFTAAAGAIYLFFHQHAGPVFKFSATRAARQRVLLCVHRCWKFIFARARAPAYLDARARVYNSEAECEKGAARRRAPKKQKANGRPRRVLKKHLSTAAACFMGALRTHFTA